MKQKCSLSITQDPEIGSVMLCEPCIEKVSDLDDDTITTSIFEL